MKNLGLSVMSCFLLDEQECMRIARQIAISAASLDSPGKDEEHDAIEHINNLRAIAQSFAVLEHTQIARQIAHSALCLGSLEKDDRDEAIAHINNLHSIAQCLAGSRAIEIYAPDDD